MMRKAAKKTRALCVILLATILSGCSTWQPVFPPGEIPLEQTENRLNKIYPGANVRIKLVSDQTLKGTVAGAAMVVLIGMSNMNWGPN